MKNKKTLSSKYASLANHLGFWISKEDADTLCGGIDTGGLFKKTNRPNQNRVKSKFEDVGLLIEFDREHEGAFIRIRISEIDKENLYLSYSVDSSQKNSTPGPKFRKPTVEQMDSPRGVCPRCREAEDNSAFQRCPWCGRPFTRRCPECSQELRPDWRFCPYH